MLRAVITLSQLKIFTPAADLNYCKILMVPSRRKEERKSASDRNWVHLTAGSLVCSASSISMSYLLREKFARSSPRVGNSMAL